MTDLSALLRVVMFEQRIDESALVKRWARSIKPERDRLAYCLRYPPPGFQQPSYTEIRDAMGYRSHSGAHDAVKRHQARLDAISNGEQS